MINKSENAYKTIGEVAKELNLINKKDGSLQTHTIRYWETQFRQISPTVKAGRRRYYSKKDFLIIKLIKFLLKDKGLTIKGARQVLEKKSINELDGNDVFGLNSASSENTNAVKNKVENILKIIKDLKKLSNG